MKLNLLSWFKAIGLLREFEEPIVEIFETIQAVDGLTGTERREVGRMVFIDANNAVQARAAEVKARRNATAQDTGNAPPDFLQ